MTMDLYSAEDGLLAARGLSLLSAHRGVHWYAVNTKPGQEETAAGNLGNRGVESFLPKLRKQRGQRWIVCPLFACYLFARFHLESQYRAVKYARGVRRIVSFGAMPIPVDGEIIAAIKGRLHDGYVTIASPPLRPGERVTIAAGPFQGLEAIFERAMKGKERVVLLLHLLSYQARLVIEREKVALVGEP